MFWQSSSALLVAKSAAPSEGEWAGFWGNDAIDQKLHDIADSGPVVLKPDLSRLKVVTLSSTLRNPTIRWKLPSLTPDKTERQSHF